MTAVEWLIDTLRQDGLHIPKIYESVAEQKEKQQIMESYKDSTCQFSVDSRIDCPKSAEQYYNETFKNK